MKINCVFVERILCGFIREELAKAGFSRGILGLSGGIDSAVCAALAARALGPENVLGLILPYRDTFPQDIADAQDLARLLGIRTRMINIAPMVDAYFAAEPTNERNLMGNKMARERMSILYDQSARDKALILGTSNKTELLIGYGTIHGDTACAVNPLGDLYKTQVRRMAAHLGIPAAIQSKVPTAGLWPGQTDEGEIGISYEELDAILFELVDRRLRAEDVIGLGHSREKVEGIMRLIRGSEFKRRMPPIAKLSARTIGLDFLYPYDWDK
ncbi:MAG: NAD+ synthase [Candidatus Aminicenantes bacterium]|nr:NAD+ synthase [Candidatus Aminicenantes bacterium]